MNPEDRLQQMVSQARGEDRVTESKWNEFVISARRSLLIQRFAAAGLAVVLLAAGAVGAATVLGDSGPNDNLQPVGPTDSPSQLPPSPTVTPTLKAEPPPDPPPDPLLGNFELWMIAESGDQLVWGGTWMGTDRGTSISDELTELISLQLGGPLGAQTEFGETTAIPRGTDLLGVQVVDEIPRINLSAEFLNGNQAEGSTRLRIAQIIFQATQVPGVDQAQILVEGEPIGGPLSRDDLTDVAPPIVVNEPKIATEHTSPLVVNGTANVFEATVTIKLEIGTGKSGLGRGPKSKTIETFATASCGSGCRGAFSKEIPFKVDKPTGARLSVYEASAEDGSALHYVVLPIRLLPN